MSGTDEQPTAEELKLGLDGTSVDWFLQRLVALANEGPLEFGVTLYVEGLIVSGQLVGGKKYFSEFAREFSDAYPGDDEARSNVRAAFESNGDIYDHEQNDELPPPQFIHLIDARCYHQNGQPLPSNRGTPWRGRINAVSGFNLGRLSESQA